MKSVIIAIALMAGSTVASHATTKCQEQVVDGHKSKICFNNPGMFMHWQFSLEVDGEHIFTLIDDFVEQISLTHRMPEGLAIEMPLSAKQGTKTVTISGGCVSVFSPKGQTEIARKCNFMWGKTPVIKEAVFEHD